eukprot:9897560-Heterocapsa_arctica.AAC.1
MGKEAQTRHEAGTTRGTQTTFASVVPHGVSRSMFEPHMRRQRLTRSKTWARHRTETATEALHRLHR